jgi:hypothetical protein
MGYGREARRVAVAKPPNNAAEKIRENVFIEVSLPSSASGQMDADT